MRQSDRFWVLLWSLLLAGTGAAIAQPVPGSLDVHWTEGARDCEKTQQHPLQVHTYEPQTYILRQSPCADFEANFIYLLIGSDRALLIDTGAVDSPRDMPLADTVLRLLPMKGGARLPLLVVHTHKHLDHRAGDPQFAGLSGVRVVPADLDSVRSFFGFQHWPGGVAHLDVGGRMVDVIPAPGHQAAHVVFYDSRTALLFSGDFLMPGRLLIEDAGAFRDSAVRVIGFLETRPVSHILGGHIELDSRGQPYSWGSQYHPDERRLELSRQDLLALPAAFDHFNGFYNQHPSFILDNNMRTLLVLATAALGVLLLGIWGLIRFITRRRKARGQRLSPA
jgi:glyoxylase-like metal-dependent hydrolase (beta-lactamase superfamily II)